MPEVLTFSGDVPRCGIIHTMKLQPLQVRNAQQMYEIGLSLRCIGRLFGVRHSTIVYHAKIGGWERKEPVKHQKDYRTILRESKMRELKRKYGDNAELIYRLGK